jgi:putative transposase
MSTYPACQQSYSKRDGHTPVVGSVMPADPADATSRCMRTARSAVSFPARGDPDGAALVLQLCALGAAGDELLAERGLDVSRRTILRWAQAFGPLLGQAVRRRRLPFGQRWFVDEVFVRIGGLQHYLYRMIDETGHVVDVLLREHRDTASAEAFFRQAQERTAGLPEEVVSDYHQPYIKALQHTWPDARHRRSGLHRARGVTTKPVERTHIPTRDRLQLARLEDHGHRTAIPGGI